MADDKTCFIIMPISTPETVRGRYRDGEEHFRHVLECLIKPSLVKAKFVPIPPIAKGSDLIHAEIIAQLETADLVLCDMSSLNANVFFEFGIRCALDKPVCVIKDDVTEKVPFDIGILNYHEYKSTLGAWDSAAQIDALAKHIEDSLSRSKDVNTLWKYFGAKTNARPAVGEQNVEGKLDLIFNQLDAMRQQFGDSFGCISGSTMRPIFSTIEHVAQWLMPLQGKNLGIDEIGRGDTDDSIIVFCNKENDSEILSAIDHEAKKRFGASVIFMVPDKAGGYKRQYVF